MPVAYGLIQPVNLKIPDLPQALDGFRILHITDTHMQKRSRLLGRILNQLTSIRHDMAVFTGDYMNRKGGEKGAMKSLEQICGKIRPAHGLWGVWGNHDREDLREMARRLPIRWLEDEASEVEGLPLEILGFDVKRRSGPDLVKLAINAQEKLRERDQEEERMLRVVLCHYPRHFKSAADMGADIMFSGHTHGGQVRLPGGRAIVNSSPLPLAQSAGIMRHQDMFLATSRGVGFAANPLKVRVFCPSQIPLYTLRRGPMPGKRTMGLDTIAKW